MKDIYLAAIATGIWMLVLSVLVLMDFVAATQARQVPTNGIMLGASALMLVLFFGCFMYEIAMALKRPEKKQSPALGER